MRRTLAALLLLAAGCRAPGPGEELLLLEDAEERSRRDVLAVYYSEGDDGTKTSIVVPRSGDAEFRSELGTRGFSGMFHNSLVQQGHAPRRERRTVPVRPEQRAALEERFAALPGGETEWTLPAPEGARVIHGPGFGPETESELPAPVTLRMVLVSRTGELQTVKVQVSNRKAVPASAKPGGEPVSALRKSFQSLFLPPQALK